MYYTKVGSHEFKLESALMQKCFLSDLKATTVTKRMSEIPVSRIQDTVSISPMLNWAHDRRPFQATIWGGSRDLVQLLRWTVAIQYPRH